MTSVGKDEWTFKPPIDGTSTSYKLNLNVQDQSGETNTSSLTIYVNKTLEIPSFSCTHYDLQSNECLISPDQT